jgi:hypothetical protein
MDSTEIPVYGQQENSAYNGHFESTCYHLLLLFNREGKQAVKLTRLSCHRFRSNEVRLWLSLIAYSLGNLWRRLVLPKNIENRSLTSLQKRMAKTG